MVSSVRPSSQFYQKKCLPHLNGSEPVSDAFLFFSFCVCVYVCENQVSLSWTMTPTPFAKSSKLTHGMASSLGTQSLPPPALPQLVAEQHVPIASGDKDSQRLIVVLSNASLETYKASHGGGGNRMGMQREEKYSLLNSDEHIGVMRKMNRDISDARPDITHQVGINIMDTSMSSHCPTNDPLLSPWGPASNMLTLTHHLLTRYIVSPYPPGLPYQQGRQAANLHPHLQGGSHRSLPHRQDTPYLQALRWSHGPTFTSSLHSLYQFSGETSPRHPEPHHRPPPAPLQEGNIEFRERGGPS